MGGKAAPSLQFTLSILLEEMANQVPSPKKQGWFYFHQNRIVKESPGQNRRSLLVLHYSWMKPPVNFTCFPHIEK